MKRVKNAKTTVQKPVEHRGNMSNLDLKSLVKELSAYVKSTDAKVSIRDNPYEHRIGFETTTEAGEIFAWSTIISNVRKQRDEVFSKEENDIVSEYQSKAWNNTAPKELEERYIKVFVSK